MIVDDKYEIDPTPMNQKDCKVGDLIADVDGNNTEPTIFKVIENNNDCLSCEYVAGDLTYSEHPAKFKSIFDFEWYKVKVL